MGKIKLTKLLNKELSNDINRINNSKENFDYMCSINYIIWCLNRMQKLKVKLNAENWKLLDPIDHIWCSQNPYISINIQLENETKKWQNKRINKK